MHKLKKKASTHQHRIIMCRDTAYVVGVYNAEHHIFFMKIRHQISYLKRAYLQDRKSEKCYKFLYASLTFISMYYNDYRVVHQATAEQPPPTTGNHK